jgi:hypothetical protein
MNWQMIYFFMLPRKTGFFLNGTNRVVGWINKPYVKIDPIILFVAIIHH